MSHEAHTHYIDYRDHRIFVVMTKYPNGWEINDVEIQNSDGERQFPTRPLPGLYSLEQAQERGLSWGKKAVDELILSGN